MIIMYKLTQKPKDFIVKDFNENVTHFKIFGAGWGHGVGLCQIGALGMALNGYSTESILGHYYPGADIINYYH